MGEWELSSPIDLTVARGQLRDAALRIPPSAGIEFDDLHRLLLAFEELAANGLRHGPRPVQVRVVGTAEGWLIDVSEADVNRPPTPVTRVVPRRPAVSLPRLERVRRPQARVGLSALGMT